LDGKKYIISLVATTSVLLIVAASINGVVDPLAKFRLSDHIYYSAERELKPRLAKNRSYDGLIIGNSKVTYIQTDDLARYGTILNAGFSAAKIEEIRYFLEETNPKVKWVGLGLDYGMFSTTPAYSIRNDKYFNNETLSEKAKYLVSIDTLRYSLKSINKRIKGSRERYTPLGSRNKKHGVEADRKKASAFDLSIVRMKKIGWLNYQYSAKRIQDLKLIQQWGDRKGIKIVAWLNPNETQVWQIVKERMGKTRGRLLSDINQILPNFVDLSTAYQNYDEFWKEHPIHYYPATGERFFSERIAPMIKTNN